MSSFTTPLRCERLETGRDWRILEDFIYEVGAEGSGVYVNVGAGFVTDFASIPRGLWNLYPPVGGRYDKAAVIHDCLYQTQALMGHPIDRGRADAIFREAMDVLGVGWWSRTVIYAGVRLGGWAIWSRYAETLQQEKAGA